MYLIIPTLYRRSFGSGFFQRGRNARKSWIVPPVKYRIFIFSGDILSKPSNEKYQ